MYTDDCDVELAGYSNSDWARNVDVRKYTIGYAFSIGSRVMSWSSKKLLTIFLSSTEAEYKTLCSATCEAIWLRKILEDVGEVQSLPTIIKCDK